MEGKKKVGQPLISDLIVFHIKKVFRDSDEHYLLIKGNNSNTSAATYHVRGPEFSPQHCLIPSPKAPERCSVSQFQAKLKP